MFKNRKYKSGTNWCVWRWTEVPSDFIRRLHVIKTPWFAICVHWLNKPDPEPYLHDHPISFLSLILKGAYLEEREVYVRDFTLGYVGVENRSKWRTWWNYFRASREDRHSIIQVEPGTVTLCFMGPKTREWGYHTEDGWVHWKTYNEEKYG